MAGPTKADVMYALLALDAYNRHGSNDSLRLLSESNVEISKQIGNATFEDSSDIMETGAEGSAGLESLAGSQDAGFSASYYTIGSGKTGLR
jgi:hypothetical protein